MKEKVLSVFIDESGDFGQYNPASPNYYVAMVLHNQEIDISKNIEALERQVSNWGYPEHTIHTGPLIRRESVYKNDLREQRKALFNALYHFTRLLDIQYICPVINQGDCAEKSKLAYTDKLTKEIAQKTVLTKSESEFFHSKNDFKKNIYKNIAKKKL